MSRKSKSTLTAQIEIPFRLTDRSPLPIQDPAFLAYARVDFQEFIRKYLDDENLHRLYDAYRQDFRSRQKHALDDLKRAAAEKRKADNAAFQESRRSAMEAALAAEEVSRAQQSGRQAEHAINALAGTAQPKTAGQEQAAHQHSPEIPTATSEPHPSTNLGSARGGEPSPTVIQPAKGEDSTTTQNNGLTTAPAAGLAPALSPDAVGTPTAAQSDTAIATVPERPSNSPAPPALEEPQLAPAATGPQVQPSLFQQVSPSASIAANTPGSKTEQGPRPDGPGLPEQPTNSASNEPEASTKQAVRTAPAPSPDKEPGSTASAPKEKKPVSSENPVSGKAPGAPTIKAASPGAGKP